MAGRYKNKGNCAWLTKGGMEGYAERQFKSMMELRELALQDEPSPANVKSSEDTITGGSDGGSRKILPHFHPDPNELESLPNQRAKEAMKSWFERLNEYADFVNEFGHGRLTLFVFCCRVFFFVCSL